MIEALLFWGIIGCTLAAVGAKGSGLPHMWKARRFDCVGKCDGDSNDHNA